MKGLSLPLKPLKKQKNLDIPVSIIFDFALVLIERALPESLKLKKVWRVNDSAKKSPKFFNRMREDSNTV